MALRQVILTVLTQGEMTGYDIVSDFDLVLHHFWHATHQSVYRELAKLNTDKCVSFRNIKQQDKPDKKVYKLTRKGRIELKEWVTDADTTGANIKGGDNLLIKILASSVVDKSVMLGQLDGLRQISLKKIKIFDEIKKEHFQVPFESLPHYEKSAYFALRRGQYMEQAQLKWLKEVIELMQK